MNNDGEKYLIFCAYCLSPVEDGAEYCTVCHGNTKNDPGVEMTQEDYLNQPRKPCQFCSKPIIVYASICFSCKKKQIA